MAEQDVQIGAGSVLGMSGVIAVTGLSSGDMNLSSMSKSTNWTMDELANSGGTYIESAIASKEYRDLKITFVAKGTSRGAARTVINTFDAFTPLKVMSVSSADVTALNITGNLLPGLETGLTREGRAECNFSIRQYRKSDGSLGALSLV